MIFACKGILRWKLGAAAGLTPFSVKLTRVPSGNWTSQRHWDTEGEFVWVIENEVVSSRREEVLRVGDGDHWSASHSVLEARAMVSKRDSASPVTHGISILRAVR